MEKTANFGLNQWEKTDRIQMEDFNADNAKLEAALSKCGNCRIETGTYIGTGKVGRDNPCALTFPSMPLVVFLSGWGCHAQFHGNDTRALFFLDSGSSYALPLTWDGTTCRWHHESDNGLQMNIDGVLYTYLSFYRADE